MSTVATPLPRPPAGGARQRLALARLLALREWRQHPWRHGMALLAVALGVALAWSVHLINASALAEFAGAVRAANGEPDLSLRSARAGVDDAWFERIARSAGVAQASPLLELDSYALAPDGGHSVVVERRKAGQQKATVTPGRSALDQASVDADHALAQLQQFAHAGQPRAAQPNHADIRVDLAVERGQRLPRPVVPDRCVAHLRPPLAARHASVPAISGLYQ